MKYIRTIVLIFLWMLLAVPSFAYDFEVDGFLYNKIYDNEVEICGSNDTKARFFGAGPLNIPETVTYEDVQYQVTSIGEKAFEDYQYRGSLTIPNSVKSIGDYAFNDCNGFTGSLSIPNSVTSIGRAAFMNCDGFDGVLTLGNSITNLKDCAFWGCTGFTGSLSIPNSVTKIGDYSFYRCTGFNGTLTIGNSLTEIGNDAFYECSGFNGSLILPNSLTIIKSYAFYKCTGFTGSLTIPNLVTSIGIDAFHGCTGFNGSLFISNSVTSISRGAFSSCSGFTGSLTISNSIATIEEDVFYGCSGFSGPLIIPESVTNIGEDSFRDCCGFTGTLTIRKSVTSIGARAFLDCKGLIELMSEIEDPFSISDYVFYGLSDGATLIVPKGTIDLYTANNWTKYFANVVEGDDNISTEYTLSVKATGNGSASYDGNTIRSQTVTFTVNVGGSATITFNPDNDYRIKSVKLNSTNVTSSVYDNQYTISNINANTTLEVEFEVIPIPTYTLSIKTIGNGSASYNGTAIREKTSSFTVNEGTKVSISLTPDNGYRIKRVKENGTNLTSYISNGTYTINSISRNTNIEVEFEAIPPTTYTLSIKALGNGSASYDGTTIRGKTSSFSINEGTSATIKFTPDNGYRIKSVKLNNTDVTSGVSDNQYTISNITANATLEVEFEAIPVPTYTLSITTTGNGSSTYDGIEVKNRMKSFTVNKGTNATITFSPDNGNSIASVKLNNSDVTSQVSGNRYTINNITDNTTLIVTFQEDVKALTVDGVNYTVVSQADRTVKVTGGDFGQVLTVPATVTQNGKTWTVTGIEGNALNGNTQLAAVIWNLDMAFTATVSNPNMLLYVKAEQYAPSSIQNVIVNGIASNIILTEAQSGNNFYCPQTFVAQKISYTHNYQMQTGLGESKGWETIALPFDVQTITHETKGTIVPFAQWNNESYNKPFWLMELTGSGFVEAGNIKANTPYIISMPNHPQYESQWLLNGKVTFAASSVTVGKTEHLNQSVYNGRTFVPCFAGEKADEGFYALNVSNDWETNKSGMTEGSKFVLNMRQVHPFEAYMTSSSNAAQYFDVFDDMTTGIHQMVDGKWMMEKAVYDLQGRKVENPSKKGVYIVNGKKMIIK